MRHEGGRQQVIIHLLCTCSLVQLDESRSTHGLLTSICRFDSAISWRHIGCRRLESDQAFQVVRMLHGNVEHLARTFAGQREGVFLAFFVRPSLCRSHPSTQCLSVVALGCYALSCRPTRSSPSRSPCIWPSCGYFRCQCLEQETRCHNDICANLAFHGLIH